jgi:hypothetical protein
MEGELCRLEIYKKGGKMKRKFPTLAIILLVIGFVWFLNDLGFLAVNLPWIPLVLIVVALGIIINKYTH